MENEIWKDVKDYEDRYQLSNTGKVFNKETNKFLKTVLKSRGHREVSLSKNRKVKQISVHRLVASHFLDNPNNLQIVFHIDGNKTNNNVTNIKWTSSSDHKKHVMKTKIKKFKNMTTIKGAFELWLSIPGYENYQVSTLGRIVNMETDKILKPTISGGYYSVNLCNLLESKKARLFRVHRIVAETFIYNPDPITKIYIDHINNNKLDNKLENLRWVTPSGNSKSYIKNHRKSRADQILQYDLNGNFIKEWINIHEIIKHNSKYSNMNLYNSLNRQNRSAYGYVWRFKNRKKLEIELQPDEEFKNIGIIGARDYSKYEISNYGNIKSLHRKQYSKSTLNSFGYYFINLPDKNTKKGHNMYIHRLIALLFVPDRTKEKNVVNHIDENKKNNYYKNLEWVTYKKNSTHSVGKKVNQIDIDSGKIINTFNSIVEATRKFKLSAGISNCCNNKQQTSGGYKWAFAN